MLLALALVGCGGGLFVGFGNGFFDDQPPSVSLTSVASALPGQTVRLSAAAADNFGIEQVAFFREDLPDTVSLGTDGAAPYEIDTQIPVGANGSVRYFARAMDIDGNVTQSATITIAIASP